METLFKHFDSVITLQGIRNDERFASAKEAVIKAENAAERRFEGVNEFRSTLGDQQRTLMPRAEVDIIVKGLTDRIDKLEEDLAASRSKSIGVSSGWGWAAGAVGLGLAAASVLRG